jgi:hypothetical protein
MTKIEKAPADLLLETLEERLKNRQKTKVERRSPEELQDVLIEKAHPLYRLLAEKLEADSTITRLYFKDVFTTKGFEKEFEELYAFFKMSETWDYIEVFRAWMRGKFDYRIRVEGDPRYAGYYFEFA